MQHHSNNKTQGRPFNPNDRIMISGRKSNSKFENCLGGYLNCQSIQKNAFSPEIRNEKQEQLSQLIYQHYNTLTEQIQQFQVSPSAFD